MAHAVPISHGNIYWPIHRCTASNDQFTWYMNLNIGMHALTYQIELSWENVREWQLTALSVVPDEQVWNLLGK